MDAIKKAERRKAMGETKKVPEIGRASCRERV